jgi:hypothetical protein
MKKGPILFCSLIACLILSALLFSQVAVAPVQEPAVQAQAPPPAPPPCLGKFASHSEAESFLTEAKIVKSKGISVGITGPQKLTLEKDGRQEFAAFKSIDEHKSGVTQLGTGPELDFKDSWKYEVAAYQVDKLIGLNMTPPTVERVHGGRRGSVQLWIDGCMTEGERIKKKLSPPGPIAWRHFIYRLRVFDNLIYNIDRNLGNMLITPDWKVVMIDHSRAFKSVDALKAAKDLEFFSKSLMEGLKALDEKGLQAACGKWLTGPEIRTMLQRRDKIMELYAKAEAEKKPGVIYP